MRFLLSIIIILTFVSCKHKKTSLNLATKEFKYSAYYWHFNQEADSIEFYLVHYINIDQKGNFELMRHDKWLGRNKYFGGIINDTLRLLINSTFSKEDFKYDYTWKIEDGTYDGYTYCLDYKKADSNTNKIMNFIPYKSPSQIQQVSSYLDNLIYQSITKKLDTLYLKNYSDKLEQQSVLEHGGRLPKPTKPPIIKDRIPRFKS